jgi:hypothetical protein
MTDYFEVEGATEDVMSHEYNVKDRCQQIGISLDNVRYRVGPDRFKWLALLILLKFKNEHNMFDEESISYFYNSVITKIHNLERKNSLLCVLVYYACLDNGKFKINDERLGFIEKTLLTENEFLFQEHGVKFVDIVRYIRLFQSIF